MAPESKTTRTQAINGAGALDATLPLYARIRKGLKEAILNGTYEPGARIPSESELAEEFSTSRVTVRLALSELVYEGLIVRRSGLGSYVSPTLPVRSPIDSRYCLTFEQQVALTGRSVGYAGCDLRAVTAPEEVRIHLRLAGAKRVYRLERIRVIDGENVGLEERYMSREIGARVTDDMLRHRPVIDFVRELVGEPIPTIAVSVMGLLASPDVAAKLGVRENSALIVRENSYHLGSGRPIVWGRSTYRGEIRIDYVLGQPLPGGD